MRLFALSRACEVFSLVAKVIWIALVLLRSVIGLPNSRHYLSQLNARLKPAPTCSLVFSRASSRLPVSTLSSLKMTSTLFSDG